MLDWPELKSPDAWPESKSLDRKPPEPKSPHQSLLELGAAIREGRRQHGLTQMRLERSPASTSRASRGWNAASPPA
jgi:hypothetical protein